MKNLFYILTISCLCVLVLTACTSSPETDITEDEVFDLIEEVDGDGKVKGSCAAYGKSTCIDYVGSFWTNEQMTLNCSGPDVTFMSDKTCNYADFGGCNMGTDTFTEIVTWHYEEGSGGYNAESIPYAIGACNALPMASWVMPDDFLN